MPAQDSLMPSTWIEAQISVRDGLERRCLVGSTQQMRGKYSHAQYTVEARRHASHLTSSRSHKSSRRCPSNPMQRRQSRPHIGSVAKGYMKMTEITGTRYLKIAQ